MDFNLFQNDKQNKMVIYENSSKGIEIEVVRQINSEIQALLWSMKWGTNGPVYQKVKNSDKDNNIQQFELKSKQAVASDILDKIETYF